MSPSFSSTASNSASASPPESPSLRTPPEPVTPRGTSSMSDIDAMHVASIGDVKAPMLQADIHMNGNGDASGHFSTRPVFTSASQPSDTSHSRERGQAGAHREHRPHDITINMTNLNHGFIEGPPSSTSPDTPYTPADGKKEPPELAQYGGQPFPLSRANGGASSQATESGPSRFYDSVPYWLGMYFFFNLGLTLFNKVVLVSFPFPYTLTGLHALSGCAGTYIALERGAFTPARLSQKESLILGAFSVLYTINIAVSNISLQLVTVPFHQVVRAATPLFTIFITAVILRQRFSARKLVSLLPVVAGVGFATYGDYYFTAWGLILTLLGTFLAALKTVVTNVIQTGGGGRLKLHPLDLLMRMSPLAFVQCVFYSWYTGELERVRRYGATQMTQSKAIALFINGIIACGLNIVSFTANKKAGALTMTVSANCKQVLTIALAVVLFDLNITITNGIGIFLTLCGGACYAFVEHTERSKPNTGAKEKLATSSAAPAAVSSKLSNA